MHEEVKERLSKIEQVKKQTFDMVREFVLDEIFPDWKAEDFTEAYGLSTWYADVLLKTQNLAELLQLLTLAELDFGITIRSAGGRQITFFPEENLGPDGGGGIFEENVIYPPEEEGEDLSFEEALDSPSWGEGARPASPCENCLERTRASDKRLCAYCLRRGVEASPLEEEEISAWVDTSYYPTPQGSLAAIADLNATRQQSLAREAQEEEFPLEVQEFVEGREALFNSNPPFTPYDRED